MGSFADALNRSMESIVRPPPIPLGLYTFRVAKMPDPPEEIRGKDGTPYDKLTIQVEVLAPYEVDEDALAEYKGNPQGTKMRRDFLFNKVDEVAFDRSLNDLKSFMEKCGVDVSTGTLMSQLTELPNLQFIGEVTHRPDPNDPEIIYAELGRKIMALS